LVPWAVATGVDSGWTAAGDDPNEECPAEAGAPLRASDGPEALGAAPLRASDGPEAEALGAALRRSGAIDAGAARRLVATFEVASAGGGTSKIGGKVGAGAITWGAG